MDSAGDEGAHAARDEDEGHEGVGDAGVASSEAGRAKRAVLELDMFEWVIFIVAAGSLRSPLASPRRNPEQEADAEEQLHEGLGTGVLVVRVQEDEDEADEEIHQARQERHSPDHERVQAGVVNLGAGGPAVVRVSDGGVLLAVIVAVPLLSRDGVLGCAVGVAGVGVEVGLATHVVGVRVPGLGGPRVLLVVERPDDPRDGRDHGAEEEGSGQPRDVAPEVTRESDLCGSGGGV